MMTSFKLLDLGLCSYLEVLEFQEQLFQENIALKNKNCSTKNTILICEHPHVITVGKNAENTNLLVSEKLLADRNIEFVKTNRGGDITYHGPGQLVVYPVLDLENFGIGLKEYIFRLEEIMIRLSDLYGILAVRYERGTGVWVTDEKTVIYRKLGAIGVRSSRFITMHGFALNVNTDLSFFRLINPCGFTDEGGVTSLAIESSAEKIDMDKIKHSLIGIVKDVFSLS